MRIGLPEEGFVPGEGEHLPRAQAITGGWVMSEVCPTLAMWGMKPSARWWAQTARISTCASPASTCRKPTAWNMLSHSHIC